MNRFEVTPDGGARRQTVRRTPLNEGRNFSSGNASELEAGGGGSLQRSMRAGTLVPATPFRDFTRRDAIGVGRRRVY